jgi:hypothetical protein
LEDPIHGPVSPATEIIARIGKLHQMALAQANIAVAIPVGFELDRAWAVDIPADLDLTRVLYRGRQLAPASE